MDIINKGRQGISLKKKLVFHLGVNAGFFSEYNNMVLAILYCLSNDIEFQLYSKDANFGFNNGWTDYFLPFTTESKWSYHSKYNFRSFTEFNWFASPGLTKKINFYKTISNTDYLTYEIFDEIRNNNAMTRYYNIPEFNICGDIRNACNELVKMTWKYNEETKKIVDDTISSLNIPSEYIGIHVRSGDKSKEYAAFQIENYIERVKSITDIKTIFVSTDDFNNIKDIQNKYPELDIYFLCRQNASGYFQSEFEKSSRNIIRQHMHELFSSIEILTNSKYFVGTFSSNIGVFMGMRMDPRRSIGIDFDKWKVW